MAYHLCVKSGDEMAKSSDRLESTGTPEPVQERRHQLYSGIVFIPAIRKDCQCRLVQQAQPLHRAQPTGLQDFGTDLRARLGPVYGHSTMVVDIAWSPDGEKLATACRDGLVTIWPKRKLATHRNSIQITQAPLTCIAWSPDGRAIAVSGVGEFWLHDIQTTGNRRHVALGMTVDDGFRFNRYRLANAQSSFFDQTPITGS